MTESYFFVGIGGSGMLPLAQLMRARGAKVAGSDRAHDQGRTPEKFAALGQRGISLHPQDGSGVRAGQTIVASAAIEDSVPDIAAANRLGLPRLTRAELLARLFNAAPVGIAIGGTSGKSTVTGMTGWILDQAGWDPTIINGAVMKNYASGARIGGGDTLVSEVDESDGSIALYRPAVAVVTNIALDHKSMAELRALFAGFIAAARLAVLNADNAESAALGPAITYGFAAGADVRGTALAEAPDSVTFTVTADGETAPVALRVPGRHNASNALAAIAAARAAGVPLAQAAAALATFAGSNRRMDVIGSASGVTVIDDFGHNPDKVAATLSTLHAFPGRLLVFFQPHGYGPLKLMAQDLAASFAANLAAGDRLIVSDPAYFGGTTDRSVGSDALTAGIPGAEHIPAREACADRLIALARPGDRIVVMGARDDSLTGFAQGLLARLG